jgi:hypothetical protein
MSFKRCYTCIEAKDLKPENIYARLNQYAGSGKPVLVYLFKVFKGDKYQEETEGLNYHDVTGRMGTNARRGSTTDFALYTELNKHAFTSWTVSYACDGRNGVGFVDVSRKLVPEIEEFMAHVEMLTSVSLRLQNILDNGFPTILDALVRLTGQADLKKKIQTEPQLVKLFERIDDSLS